MSDKFTFTGADGNEYALPKKIPSGALRAARKLDPLDAAYTLLEQSAAPEVLAATDAMDAADTMRMLNDWMQGLTAPQSSSSSN